MAIMTGTNTQSVGIDILSTMVQQYLKENAVLIPTIVDRTIEAVQKGVKSIEIGRAAGLSIGSEDLVDDGTTGYTEQDFTWVTDTLDLDTQCGVYVVLTKKGDFQSVLNQEPELIERAIDSLTTKLEERIFAKIKAAHANNKFKFKSGYTLSYQDVTNAKKVLDKNKVPKSDRFMIINPEQEEDLLNLELFHSAEKYGNNSVLMNGEIGRISGFTVLTSLNVEENNTAFYHRTTSAFARQWNVSFEKNRILKTSSYEYLLETLYGLVTLDAGVRAVLVNETGV
jgi:N4-gp56 family major capsid protein